MKTQTQRNLQGRLLAREINTIRDRQRYHYNKWQLLDIRLNEAIKELAEFDKRTQSKKGRCKT